MYDMELSYRGMKDTIKTELNRVAESFVEIGYQLKQVRDGELYKIDGYSNINEFAKSEYSLSQSTTSRFIAINDKYSVDGSSPKLLEQYEGYGYSKLSEMLTLSDDEMELITVQTTRAEIREIKQAKDEAKEAGIYAPAHNTESLENTQSESHFDSEKKYIFPDAEKLFIELFRDKAKRDILKELAAVLSTNEWNKGIEAKVSEIINPSGHYMFRLKFIILIFEEDHIKYTSFGESTTQYTYGDVIEDLIKIFDMSEKDPWVAFYGEPEPEPEPPKKEPEKPVNKPVNNVDKKDTTSKHVDKQPMKPNITQSNEVKEISEQEEQSDIIPGQKNINDYPEYKPNGSSEEEESDIETSDIDTEEEETVIESKETVSETEEIVIKNIETVNEVVEKVEADIVEKTSQDDELHNDDSQLLYKDNNLEISLYSETGELKIIINNNIHAIKAINSHTGNLWEVEVD